MNYGLIDYFNFTLIATGAAYGIEKDYTPEDDPNFSEAVFKRSWEVLSRMLARLLRSFPGVIFFACSDTAGGTQFRKELNPDYKANRTGKKVITFEQMDQLGDLYRQMGVQVLKIPQCEGDDAIYALARVLKEKEPEASITIVSRDHDMLQTIQAGYATNQYDPSKKVFIEVPSFPVVDIKAIVGDSSDNIKGFPRVGEKTAVKYLLGLKEMNEDEKKIYERNLLVIDASKHPRLQENLEAAREFLRSLNG